MAGIAEPLVLVDSLLHFAASQVAKADAAEAFRARARMTRELNAFVRDISAYFAGLASRLQVGEVEVAKYVGTDWEREARLLAEALEPGRKTFLNAGLEQAGSELGVGLRGGLDLGDYDTSIKDRLANLVTDINDTTRTRIQNTVATSIQSGQTRDLLDKALQTQIQGWAASSGRSRTIALTESALGYNLGQMQGYRQSGIVEEVRIFDGADCGWTSHQDGDKASGSIRTLDEAEEYPIAHPNCQRSWAPIVARAASEEAQRSAREAPSHGQEQTTEPGKQTDTRDIYGLDREGTRWTPERQWVHERYYYREYVPDGLPTSDAPHVYMTGGGPSSGKSSLLDHFPGRAKSAYINADDAKAALPEYRQGIRLGDKTAANAVHEESSYMSKTALQRALTQGNDAVYDSVANGSLENLAGKVGKMRVQGGPGTRVSAEYMFTDIDTALERAYLRGQRTGRFIHDEEVISKHRAVSKVSRQAMDSGVYDDMTFYSNNVPKNQPPIRVARWTRESGLEVYDEAQWARFIDIDSTYTGRWSSMNGEVGLRPPTAPARIIAKEEADDWALTWQGNIRTDLPPEAESSIRNYTTNWYAPVNTSLRRKPFASIEPEVQQSVTAIDAAMRPLPDTVEVYRVVKLNAYGMNDTASASIVEKRIAGSYVDKAFQSTTIDREIATQKAAPIRPPSAGRVYDRILMTLRVPRGTRAVYVDPLSNIEEGELLLDRGLTVVVESVTAPTTQEPWWKVAATVR